MAAKVFVLADINENGPGFCPSGPGKTGQVLIVTDTLLCKFSHRGIRN